MNEMNPAGFEDQHILIPAGPGKRRIRPIACPFGAADRGISLVPTAAA